jgi:transcriptional regulator with PAS, ATPase and Fis domain
MPALLTSDDAARACLRALSRALHMGGRCLCETPEPAASLDLTGSAVVVVDTQRRVVLINERAAAFSGSAPQDLVGLDCRAAIRCVTCQDGCSLFGEGEVCGRQVEVLGPGGARRRVVKDGRLLRDDTDAVVGGMEVLYDVEELLCAAGESGPRGVAHPEWGIVACSPAMARVVGCVERLAGKDATVLLSGESGTGKELVARALHAAGPRAARPFHAVNCASLCASLAEAEFFGHERGAFTGATHAHPGHLEACQDGTLLLDEVGCLPLQLQSTLLRVLETREYHRVGGTRPLRLRARVLAATNADLGAQVRAGLFREDLYYRLRVVPLQIPALRQRREDIGPLAVHFAQVLSAVPGGAATQVTITPAAMACLDGYPWPGNVRELRSAIQHALCLGDGRRIDVTDLPPEVGQPGGTPPTNLPDRAQLEQVLAASRHNRTEAARCLGVSRTTLWRMMRQRGVEG